MAIGYSFGALTDASMLMLNGIGSVDLNATNSKDYYGVWFQPASSVASVARNYPYEGASGTLEITPTGRGSPAGSGVLMRLTTAVTPVREFVRRFENGVWTAWRETVYLDTLYKAIYPVGICLDFDAIVDPNTLFPGTVWAQVLDGRTVRPATVNTKGSTAGQIGSTAGSDSFSIGVSNLPAHNHTMERHTHDMDHTHAISHNHGTITTTANGNHNHTGSGTTGSNGAHSHQMRTVEYNPALSSGGSEFRALKDGGAYTAASSLVETAGAHTHTFLLTTSTNGQHNHTADIPNFIGQSGPVSVGATAMGGASATGNTGSGTSITHTGQVRYYARWKRTA